MNENQLRDQLQDFADPIRFTPRLTRRRNTLRFATVAAVLILGTVVLVIPRPSTAVAAMGRMEVALQGVRSMEAIMSIEFGDGKVKPIARYWYQGQNWRIQSRMGTPLELVFLIRDGLCYRYDRKHNVVTREPYGGWMGELTTPLNFAQEQTNFGLVGQSRSLRTEDRKLDNGQPGYALILERAEDSYRSEILVEKSTGLPVRSMTKYSFDEIKRNTQQTSFVEYRFDEAFQGDLFDPKAFGAPIVDSPVVAGEFLSRYRTPIATILNTQIHEAEVNRDGTIHVVVSVPTRKTPTPLTLTTDSGVPYVRSMAQHPGGTWGDTGVPEMACTRERDYQVLAFVPVRPVTDPDEVKLTAQNGKSVTVRTRPNEGDRPWFASGLLMNQAFDAGKIRDAEAVADWYRDQKDYETELTWRWKAHAAAVAYVRRFGELEVPALVGCLRRLGRDVEAERVQRELGPQPIKRYP